MIFQRNYFLNTTCDIDVFSVIHEVNRTVRESSLKDGLVNVIAPLPGCAVTIAEPLPDIVSVIKEAAQVFPGQGEGTKNRRKEDVSIGPRVSAAMMGKSVTVPLKDSRLCIGLREEILLIDMERDGKRREIIVTIMGDSPAPQQRQPQRR